MTMQEILAAVAAKTITVADAANLLPKPVAASGNVLRCGVSAKGGVSLYGIQTKFPVTLYAEQWERLLGFADEIKAFVKANADVLELKSDSDAVKAIKMAMPVRAAAIAKSAAAKKAA